MFLLSGRYVPHLFHIEQFNDLNTNSYIMYLYYGWYECSHDSIT